MSYRDDLGPQRTSRTVVGYGGAVDGHAPSTAMFRCDDVQSELRAAHDPTPSSQMGV